MMKYRDRQGNTFENDTAQDKLLRRLYGSVPGRKLISLLIKPRVTEIMGFFMDRSVSTLMIDGFVKKNNIQMSDYIPTRYKSYNEFFTRRIKPSKRSFDPDETVLCSPCDGKVSAYNITPGLTVNIKGSNYSVKSLLRNTELSEEMAGGVMMIIRLTVDNYHRYAYIDDGFKSGNFYIPGVFHTVNPIALEHANIYYENSREYTVINSIHFGTFIQMEVGALGVGKIVNYDEECEIYRGDEKGRFEFGGSTVVLLFEKDAIIPDADLIKNTEEGCETIIKLGERIGVSNLKMD